jgi:hypothetical protein
MVSVTLVRETPSSFQRDTKHESKYLTRSCFHKRWYPQLSYTIKILLPVRYSSFETSQHMRRVAYRSFECCTSHLTCFRVQHFIATINVLDLPCKEIVGVSGLYSDVKLQSPEEIKISNVAACHAQPVLLNVMLWSAICIGHPSASGRPERKVEVLLLLLYPHPLFSALALFSVLSVCLPCRDVRLHHHRYHHNSCTGSPSSLSHTLSWTLFACGRRRKLFLQELVSGFSGNNHAATLTTHEEPVFLQHG